MSVRSDYAKALHMGEIYRAVLKLRPDLAPSLHAVPPDAKHIAGWLDEHFPLEDKFGWCGVSMQYMGQRLLLGRRDA